MDTQPHKGRDALAHPVDALEVRRIAVAFHAAIHAAAKKHRLEDDGQNDKEAPGNVRTWARARTRRATVKVTPPSAFGSKDHDGRAQELVLVQNGEVGDGGQQVGERDL